MFKLTFITGLLIGFAILFGCGEKIQPGDHEVERSLVEGVTLGTVESSVVPEFYEAAGTIRAKNTSMISAKVMGTVETIHVNPGQRVRKNEVLLELYAPDIDAKLEGAREAVEEARRGALLAEKNKILMENTFARYEKLFEGKAITEQQYDEMKTKKEVASLQYEMALRALKRAEAGAREAEAFMEYRVIRSPLDGVIAEKKIDVGSMASPSIPLLVIEEQKYQVEVSVNESLLNKIYQEMIVPVTIDSLQVNTTAEVIEIVHQINPMTRTFTVKLDLLEEDIPYRGGLYCTARFPVGEKSLILVSPEAVMIRGQLRGVFVVNKKGVLTLRFVKTGKQRNGLIEILSGLEAGERIVVKGIDRAVDGGILKDTA